MGNKMIDYFFKDTYVPGSTRRNNVWNDQR